MWVVSGTREYLKSPPDGFDIRFWTWDNHEGWEKTDLTDGGINDRNQEAQRTYLLSVPCCSHNNIFYHYGSTKSLRFQLYPSVQHLHPQTTPETSSCAYVVCPIGLLSSRWLAASQLFVSSYSCGETMTVLSVHSEEYFRLALLGWRDVEYLYIGKYLFVIMEAP